jgi:hypothetical protein
VDPAGGTALKIKASNNQGLVEAVINVGFDPDQMAMAVIKAADGDVVPFKRIA